MNKAALRTFATNARRELLEKVQAKAMKIGITKDKITKANVESSDAIFIDGRQLSKQEKFQREKLIQRINEKDYKQVMEEVAYTWFNRFTALRFMEVNEYLPSMVRVLSSSTPGDPIPDIIKEAMSLDFEIDKEKVYEWKLNNENEKLFHYLIIKQCNNLNDYLPFMFEKIDDYTEVLFPDGLLFKDSFLRQMINTEVIPEEDWMQVEIIGWLYQYYISEEKERVIKAKKKYKTEEIPFATQLFTPDWIVRYMVQNTLGRYWVENHPEDRGLIKKWEFYIENSNPEVDFEEKLAPYLNKELKVEDIKCFDPAMGSGHILVYMFDLLYDIYTRCGYLEREIPRNIIENNLYGLDIDERAYQLACFSVVMKAMKYNNRFLRSIKRFGLTLNLSSIYESNDLEENDIDFFAESKESLVFSEAKKLIDSYKDAKTFGSIIKTNEIDVSLIDERMSFIQESPADDMFAHRSRELLIDIIPKLIKQYKIASINYDITITNPPYMGGRYMPKNLSDYLNEYYPEHKNDLFSTFINFVRNRTKKNGHIGLITPYVWMFIKNYLELRKELVFNNTFSSLVELEYNSFEGATVPVCTFTLRNTAIPITGEFIKLADFKGVDLQPLKTREAITNNNVLYRYQAKTKDFRNVTGYRIAYWFSKNSLQIFEYDKLDESIDMTGSQNITSNNNKFLRYHWEVSSNEINNRWAFYTKGGEYRKWYGNILLVVDWSQEARNHYENNTTANLLNKKYWFREGLSYNGISNRGFSVRKVGKNIYDKGGPTLHPEDTLSSYLLGLLNSVCVNEIMNLYNPTLNYQVQDVKDIPLLIDSKKNVENLVEENVQISKNDWDSNETSWNFKKHPFLNNNLANKKMEQSQLISDIFLEWEQETYNNFYTLKKNEEKLNSIFIEMYGLEGELTSGVDENDVTIRLADKTRETKSFITYAVGCMLGRYSLDEEGLIYAGGQFDASNYKIFKVDENNILPIVDGTYFEDDIVSRFVQFVRVTFGDETLDENLEFIADTLGKKKNETAKEAIRRYFLNNFFKDHVQTYKKRPIYWLFTSGKQKAFNCLVYMHRYDPSLLSRIRTDYLHELQTRMDAERESLVSIIDGDSTLNEINKAKKELQTLDKKINELKEYDEVLHRMADQQIEIDLDDGVEVNYAKFNNLLAKK
ncbi:BREX-1 system adenine-specific DNA-methyltransferase PglX [Salibacterium aidingense]|uniref:BREX-1 system adenine-specific DNA-methyltransferase PglX n=1 Tax=Salibacterium aidingense TaxID=384933 RepID=UPI0003F81511|nr:BREX-1 system adenine-specific DNA-methyltransferase PglX [Salibacterium aidingense]